MRLRHFLIAFVSFLVLLFLFFFVFTLANNLLADPHLYFEGKYTLEEISEGIVFFSGIAISALLAFVVYLLLGSNVRVEARAKGITRELAITGEEMRRLYDQAPIPYILLTKKYKIERPNKAAVRFFGFSADELEGKDIESFFIREDEESVAQILEKFRRDIPVDRQEIRMYGKGGAMRWVALSIHDMKNPAGRGRSGLVTLFDITEQKELDQAKTEFLSLAAHQLRTPLATVRWYTDMLLSESENAFFGKTRDYIMKVHEGNQNMIDLVNLLLNISRIQLGKFEVNTETTDIHEIMESVLRELGPQIEQKQLRVEKHFDDVFLHFQTDPKLLRIVIQNLVSNAVKYTPEGGSVRVALRVEGKEKKVIVADTGYGIPENEKEKIFTKLFRAQNIKQKNVEGTGLGLYMVKQIVDMMGGIIPFTSEVNKGTIFTVTFKN